MYHVSEDRMFITVTLVSSIPVGQNTQVRLNENFAGITTAATSKQTLLWKVIIDTVQYTDM